MFDTSELTHDTVNGKELPSCGEVAIATMRSYLPAKVGHIPGRDIVHVNGESWKSAESHDDSFAQRPLKEGSDLYVTLRFTSRESLALGAMIGFRRDSDHKMMCIDHLMLRVTYRR